MTTLESEPANRIQFADGFSADQNFFDQEIGWVLLRVPKLPRGRIYLAKQLHGKERWDLLSDGERKLVGRCIAYAVCHGLLPLQFVKGAHEYPLHYRIL
jgi:hypothetical protein